MQITPVLCTFVVNVLPFFRCFCLDAAAAAAFSTVGTCTSAFSATAASSCDAATFPFRCIAFGIIESIYAGKRVQNRNTTRKAFV
ncbi:hypothetical protein GQ54DRAFT_203132 [Martensiomyces pterosporus]|nr:hypothetical protein GQ54DRAFT_203132 [Martensiomyces pterosporus]